MQTAPVPPHDPPHDPPPDPPPGLQQDLNAIVDEAFNRPDDLGTTHAVVVVHHGRTIAERYGGVLEHWDRPPEPVGPDTLLLSWSMAKSMQHAAVGILVGDGVLDPDARTDVPQWADPADPRNAITLEHLLTMRDGLDFTEDYVDDRVSDVIEMLFGAGVADTAAFGAERALLAEPGTCFNYSSGTSNVISGIVARAVGAGEQYEHFLRTRVFEPAGMTTARPTLDQAGTWIASSYVHATAQDFARFGQLYLHDGVDDAGNRVLPAGWVDHGRRVRSQDEDGKLYGAHWWVVGDEWDSYRAAGYEGQTIVVSPGLDSVIVRLGKSPAEMDDALLEWRTRLIEAVALLDAGG